MRFRPRNLTHFHLTLITLSSSSSTRPPAHLIDSLLSSRTRPRALISVAFTNNASF
ncbi:hypothetical protein Hanom_Chr00s055444g01782541 [Helianthus anomalus]